jgi:hypothetical protein
MNRAARGVAQAHPPAEIACARGFPEENTNAPGSFALQKKIRAVCEGAPFAPALLDARTRSAPVSRREGGKEEGARDRSLFLANKNGSKRHIEEDQVEGWSVSYSSD